MSLVSADLPDDVETLRRMALEQAQALEIEKLKVQLDRLRRLQFGRSSEKLDRQIEQLELRLEDLEEDLGRSEQMVPAAADPLPADQARPARKPLPDHLPRDEIVHEPACACPRCGGELRRLGEDVTEVLDNRLARFHVVRHVRPKLSCRRCEAVVQAQLPPPDGTARQPPSRRQSHLRQGEAQILTAVTGRLPFTAVECINYFADAGYDRE